MSEALRRRIEGHLLGVAVGDALGLGVEGLPPRRDRVLRYALVAGVGVVSDDTEQTALVAAALCRRTEGDDAVVRAFRRGLLGWFLRLPFGVGFATLRACSRLALGLSRSGVPSAGNGSAMRAGVVGLMVEDPVRRRLLSTRLAEVTHTHADAIAAACFVADVAAGAVDPVASVPPGLLRDRLERASAAAAAGMSVGEAATALGTSGWVVESVPFAWWCLCRFGPTFAAIEAAVAAGGDTDSNAAIVGGWVGAAAPDQIPSAWVDGLARGPFGATHLRALASALAEGRPAPSYAWWAALARNVALFPVVLWVVATRRLWA